MARLCWPLALLALVLLALLCGPGEADPGQDCCLGVRPRPFSVRMKKKLVSYRLQGPWMGCQQEAVVFITKKGRELCVSPYVAWASEIKREIDARNRNAAAKRPSV